jgi:SHS2 domain-containing protein
MPVSRRIVERSGMKPYKIIEHTSDIGLEVNAPTLKELFENAARGMFAVIRGSSASFPRQAAIKKEITVKKEVVEGPEELLVDWLSELLYLFFKERVMFSEFKVFELNNSGLRGAAFGDKIKDIEKEVEREIKAVTYHRLSVEETAEGFRVTIIFDV